MARSLDDIYRLFEDIVKKERGIFVSYPQKDRWFNAAQLEVFEYYYKLYGIDDSVHDALSPFKVDIQFTSAADGTVTLPLNCQHFLPNVFTVTGSTINEVRFVNEDEWVKAMTSQLRPATTSNPIAKDYGNGFTLFPQVTQIGKLTYFRLPNAPFFAFTIGGSANRTITYNSAGSTQLEWDDVYINKIISVALEYAGVNMSEAEITQFGAAKNQET